MIRSQKWLGIFFFCLFVNRFFSPNTALTPNIEEDLLSQILSLVGAIVICLESSTLNSIQPDMEPTSQNGKIDFLGTDETMKHHRLYMQKHLNCQSLNKNNNDQFTVKSVIWITTETNHYICFITTNSQLVFWLYLQIIGLSAYAFIVTVQGNCVLKLWHRGRKCRIL